MGKRLKLSNGRRLVDDVIQMSITMPLAGLSGDYDVSLVSKFRRLTKPKIAWNVLYMKAYAAVCQEMPELRRCYASFPFAHLYEHEHSVGMMTIAREHKGEERLFFARFNCPDRESLVDLQKQYDIFRHAPIEEIKQFRHQITFAKFPRPIRKLAWWTLYNVWPRKRASHMGTFGMSFSGYKKAFGSKHLGCNTSIIGVDPTPRKGSAHTLLTFDHRVIDGVPATKVLQRVHDMLRTAIRVELAEIAGVDSETGDPLSENQLLELKRVQRSRRIETNRRKSA